MDKANRDSLETHIVLLYDLMQKMRTDLALLTDTDADKPVLDTVADQLIAIADDSEKSSENILEANGNIAKVAEGFIKEIKYTGARHKFESILGSCVKIKLASDVQEAAYKRISNVVETINQVEGTLNSLVVKVGNGGVAGLETALSGVHMMDDETVETIPMKTHKAPEKSALEKLMEEQ